MYFGNTPRPVVVTVLHRRHRASYLIKMEERGASQEKSNPKMSNQKMNGSDLKRG